MTEAYELLGRVLRSALRGEKVNADTAAEPEIWLKMMRLAGEHQLSGLVYDAVYRCPSFCAIDPQTRGELRQQAVSSAIRQAIQTNEFLTLILHAQEAGLRPIVLKGIIVRELYPVPILRPSIDEDLLIPQDSAAEYHAFLLSEGLAIDDPEADVEKAGELSYHRADSPTYIELHTLPFPAESDAYGDCNEPFSEAREHTVTVRIQDVELRTLCPTDHLLYLILHAYKHFLHSGVGIRQVADVCIMSEHFAAELDYDRILCECRTLRIELFASALFRIGRDYLGFSVPAVFLPIETDAGPLLDDILSGGLYGANDINRVHSSTLTLDAVSASKSGKRRGGMFASLFPSYKQMCGKYPYLRKAPVLLPAAWVQRGFAYLFRRGNNVRASESLRIGRERIELMKKYGIIGR